MKAFLLVAHGSRRSESTDEIVALTEKLRGELHDRFDLVDQPAKPGIKGWFAGANKGHPIDTGSPPGSQGLFYLGQNCLPGEVFLPFVGQRIGSTQPAIYAVPVAGFEWGRIDSQGFPELGGGYGAEYVFHDRLPISISLDRRYAAGRGWMGIFHPALCTV